MNVHTIVKLMCQQINSNTTDHHDHRKQHIAISRHLWNQGIPYHLKIIFSINLLSGFQPPHVQLIHFIIVFPSPYVQVMVILVNIWVPNSLVVLYMYISESFTRIDGCPLTAVYFIRIPHKPALDPQTVSSQFNFRWHLNCWIIILL